jgi:hypothetical protein
MTALAQVSGNWMRSRFVGGVGAGMTSRTRIGGLVVWKRFAQWQPGTGTVTGLAGIAGQGMSGYFIGCAVAARGSTGIRIRLIVSKR